MSENTPYVPPRVWVHAAPSGGTFAGINRPVAGATHDKALPVGRHPLQLYSLGTPNGMKVSIMLEELLALGHAGLLRRRQALEEVGDVDLEETGDVPELGRRDAVGALLVFLHLLEN